MRADRHTDTLVAIPRNPRRSEVTMAKITAGGCG